MLIVTFLDAILFHSSLALRKIYTSNLYVF